MPMKKTFSPNPLYPTGLSFGRFFQFLNIWSLVAKCGEWREVNFFADAKKDRFRRFSNKMTSNKTFSPRPVYPTGLSFGRFFQFFEHLASSGQMWRVA